MAAIDYVYLNYSNAGLCLGSKLNKMLWMDELVLSVILP
jgi:hypothetical protein